MLRVLMFLLENYGGQKEKLLTDQDILSSDLERAGFNPFEINDALSWLEGFGDFEERSKSFPKMSSTNVRFYDLEEKERIDERARGLLLFLEQSEVLTPELRELAIDRAMAMDDYIDVAQMKWIVLITLFYHPSQTAAFSWMQELVVYGDRLH